MPPANPQKVASRISPKSAAPSRVLTRLRSRVVDPVNRVVRDLLRQPGPRAAVHILIDEERESIRRGEVWERSLNSCGVTTKVAPLGKESFSSLLAREAAFVVAGTPRQPRLENFLQFAREQKRIVVLDSSRDAVRPEVMLDLLSSGGPELPRHRSLAINWVVRAPIAERSGRAQVVFRIANELGRRGHRVRVYIDPVEHLSRLSPGEIVDYMERYFGPLFLEPIIGLRRLSDADVAIATCWKSSEFVARDRNSLFRFRFLQELEENLYPESHRYFRRAKQAYHLPLRAFAFGRTLAPRVEERSLRPVEAIDLAVDQSRFFAEHPPKRQQTPRRILFYARPDRAERGFSLGMKALRLLAQRDPNLEITLFGSQEEDVGFPDFTVRYLGIPSRSVLAAEMNRAQIVLSLSLSGTVSTVALEAMACGAVVVESELSGLADILSPGEGYRLAPAEPAALAATIHELLENAELRSELASGGIAAMKKRDWASSLNQFERALLQHCFATTDFLPRPAHLAAASA